MHLLTSANGTDRRTGVCGTDRCYQASSRHQPLPGAVASVENDPTRTKVAQDFCSAHCRSTPISPVTLSCFDGLS
jgi:hypothetical protein